MRIIAGELGGRRLLAPRGLGTRPTSDRVKEALFNMLGAPEVEGSGRGFRVLDLFAGSGALGLEAASRGADEVILIEEDRFAAEVADRNVAELGLLTKVKVVRREVGAALIAKTMQGPFDWVFLDPPYDGGHLDRALRLLGGRDLLARSGVACAEHHARTPPAEQYGVLTLDKRRAWGETAISFYRVNDGAVDMDMSNQ